MNSTIMDTDSTLPALLGERIAARRADARLSLDELAGLTGVSRAMISRIERGEVHASAVVLDRLCNGLGLSLADLFARETANPLLRRGEQPVWQDASGYVRRTISPLTTGSTVRISEIEFPPGAEVTFDPGIGGTSGQYVWMLEGRMEITTDGTSHELGPGDCLFMRPEAGNGFRNPGKRPARYAVIIHPETGR